MRNCLIFYASFIRHLRIWLAAICDPNASVLDDNFHRTDFASLRAYDGLDRIIDNVSRIDHSSTSILSLHSSILREGKRSGHEAASISD